jgi:hypothetical protein
VLLLLGLVTSACQDLPTGRRAEDNAAVLNRGGVPAAPTVAGKSSASWASCLISKRTPGGPQRYRYVHVRGIELPQSAEEVRGRTTVLRLTFQSPGEPVLAQVNCRIPATQMAADVVIGMFVRQSRRSRRPMHRPPPVPSRGASS